MASVFDTHKYHQQASQLFEASLGALAKALRENPRYQSLRTEHRDNDRALLGAYIKERLVFKGFYQANAEALSFLDVEGLNPEKFTALPHAQRQLVMDALHDIGLEGLWEQPNEAPSKQAVLDRNFAETHPNFVKGEQGERYRGKTSREVLREVMLESKPLLRELDYTYKQAEWAAKIALADQDVGLAYAEGAERLKQALTSTDVLNEEQQQAVERLKAAKAEYMQAVSALKRAEKQESLSDAEQAFVTRNSACVQQLDDLLNAQLTNTALQHAPEWLRETLTRSVFALDLKEVFTFPTEAESRETVLAAPMQTRKWHFMLALENIAYDCGMNEKDLVLQSSLNRQLSTHQRGGGNPAMGSINRYAHNPSIHSRHVASLGHDLFQRARQHLVDEYAAKLVLPDNADQAKQAELTAERDRALTKLASTMRSFMRTAGKHDMGELLSELSVAGNRVNFTGAALEAFEKKRGQMEDSI